MREEDSSRFGRTDAYKNSMTNLSPTFDPAKKYEIASQIGEYLSEKETDGIVRETVHGMQAWRVENVSFTSCIRKIDDRDLQVRYALHIKDCT